MLAPVECYTTIGVFDFWQSKNNGVLSICAEPFCQQEENRNNSFSPLVVRPRREQQEAARVYFVSQNSAGNFTQLCRNSTAPKTLLVANISAIKLGLILNPHGHAHPHKIGDLFPIF